MFFNNLSYYILSSISKYYFTFSLVLHLEVECAEGRWDSNGNRHLAGSEENGDCGCFSCDGNPCVKWTLDACFYNINL